MRIGINTGEVIAADSDPVGAAVNAAARIAARATGGDVLVSDVVRQLVGAVPAIRFVDRGRFRLKGFSERWRLWAAHDGIAQLKMAPTTGRVTELAAVAELVNSTAVGIGRVLLFEGEPGIGKTHLVREATGRARQAGVVVVEATADELVRRPGVVPHALLDATRDGPRSRDRLDALLNRTRSAVDGGEDLSFAVVESSVEVVEEMARTAPVLVAAEDLHWADDLSIMVLAALVRRAAVSRFGVIGSMRLSPRRTALDRLVERVRDGMGVHVRLGPLAEVDVIAMANAIIGSVSGEQLRDKLRMTAGNPLFVSELLRSFDDDGLLRIDGGVADIDADATPATLHDTLVRRLSWLPSETSDLLRLASLLGTTFSLRELAAIEGRGVPDVAACLREASLAGLIVGDADRLAFRHDLIREAVYSHMLAGERRALHRAAGQALAGIGSPTQQVADQFARGADLGDVEAITWLERAARDTVSVSPVNAVALLEQAVGLVTPGWRRRTALQARMIEPLALCGRHDEAIAIAEGILATSPDAEVEYAALCGLRTVHSTLGHTSAEIAALHRAAAAPGAPVDETHRLRCIAAQLSTFTGAMTIEDARTVVGETLARARADHDATTQAVAHQMLGMIAGIAGYGVESRDHFAAAIARFDAEPVPHGIYPVPNSLHALSLLELDALDEAGAAADHAREQAELRGASSRLPLAYLAAGAARYYAGSWDEAVGQFEAGLAVIEETGHLSLVLYYEAALARIAIHRGDLTDAQKHLTVGVRHFTEGVSHYGADWLFAAQSEFLSATGDVEAALAIAEATWTQTAHVRYSYGHRGRGVLLVRLATATARDALAASVTRELEEGARRSPAASAAGAAQQCRGLVERDPNVALAAVARYQTTPLRPDLATCDESAAELLIAAGRRNEAVALLLEAATIHAELDSAGDLERIGASLRRLGEKPPRLRQSRPATGWKALTSTESNVSLLVAQGLTNPEIGRRLKISRRTVETHLSRIFGKLGVANRTQLAAEVPKRLLASSPHTSRDS